MPGVHHQSDSSTAPSTVFQGIKFKLKAKSQWLWKEFTQVQNGMPGWQYGELYLTLVNASPPLYQPISLKWKPTNPTPEAEVKAMKSKAANQRKNKS